MHANCESRANTGVRADRARTLDFPLFKNFSLAGKALASVPGGSLQSDEYTGFGSPGTTVNGVNFGVTTGQSHVPRNLLLALKLLF
jgi:hypothetical protein